MKFIVFNAPPQVIQKFVSIDDGALIYSIIETLFLDKIFDDSRPTNNFNETVMENNMLILIR